MNWCATALGSCVVIALGCVHPESPDQASRNESLGVKEIVFEQTQPRGSGHPWRIIVRPPSDWQFLLDGSKPSGEVAWTDDSAIERTTRVLKSIADHKLLERDGGRFGLDVPDWPYMRITIQADGLSKTFRLGSLFAMRRMSTEKQEDGISAFEVWCDLRREFQLPKEAHDPFTDLESRVATARKRLQSVAPINRER
jgi:hypothetical protein